MNLTEAAAVVAVLHSPNQRNDGTKRIFRAKIGDISFSSAQIHEVFKAFDEEAFAIPKAKRTDIRANVEETQ